MTNDDYYLLFFFWFWGGTTVVLWVIVGEKVNLLLDFSFGTDFLIIFIKLSLDEERNII